MQHFYKEIRRQLLLSLSLILLFTSCNLFENKENKAIEICQKSKAQMATSNIWQYVGLSISGLSADATWLDYANILAKESPNTKLDWSATKTDKAGIYLVTFADNDGWGHRWEVDIDQQVVRSVNTNEYLSRKYGLSRLDGEQNFQITDITKNNLQVEKKKTIRIRKKKILFTI